VSPPAQFDWSSAGATDAGRVRLVNEDAVGLHPEVGLWVVADGMGGHNGGDTASAAVVEALGELTFPSSLETFIDSVRSRLESVNRFLVSSAGDKLMGSTAVVLLAHADKCACLWVGDSRAYRLRNDVMHAMTRDHSYVEELVQKGQITPGEAERHPQSNIITRAIGASETVDIEICRYDLENGDRYLLCSDGLYREVSEQELLLHMQHGSCETVVQTLLELALQRGARDNVAVVAVDFHCTG
jgi:serine/threonine protein phosphatase PrpC